MDTHEVLVAARNLLDREGWTPGTLGSSGAAKCAWGACIFAAQNRGGLGSAYDKAGDLFTEVNEIPVYGGRWAAIARWNDAEDRTKEEVLAAFDKAIAATAPLPQDLVLEVPVEQTA